LNFNMNFAEAVTEMMSGRVVETVPAGKSQFRIVKVMGDFRRLQHRTDEGWVVSTETVHSLLNLKFNLVAPDWHKFQGMKHLFRWNPEEKSIYVELPCHGSSKTTLLILARRVCGGYKPAWRFDCHSETVDEVLAFSKQIDAHLWCIEVPDEPAPPHPPAAREPWQQLELPFGKSASCLKERLPDGDYAQVVDDENGVRIYTSLDAIVRVRLATKRPEGWELQTKGNSVLELRDIQPVIRLIERYEASIAAKKS
jgi:hypothetical protein